MVIIYSIFLQQELPLRLFTPGFIMVQANDENRCNYWRILMNKFRFKGFNQGSRFFGFLKKLFSLKKIVLKNCIFWRIVFALITSFSK